MENIKRLWPLLAVIVFVICFTSCDDPVPGCTDEQSINFNADATEDDGSCMFERDAFLGQYLGEFSCGNPLLGFLNNDSLTFEIKEPVDDSDKSIAILALSFVDLASTINGNELILSDTIRGLVIPDVELLGTITADVIGNGVAILEGDSISGNIDLELDITSPPGLPTIIDNCTLTGVRN